MTLFWLLVTIGLVILGFFLLVDSISYLITNTGDRGDSRTDRRIRNEKVSSALEHIDIVVNQERQFASYMPLGQLYEKLAASADINLPPYRVYLITALLIAAIFAGFVFFLPFFPKSILFVVAFFTGVAMPIFYLKNRAKARVERFQEQFPDALDLIVRSLKVGHPLSAALGTIADEIPAPIGHEFGIAARQIAYGKSTTEAIGGITNRIDLSDVRFFAVAVQIHNESGGNLAEILSGLSSIIRGRFQLFRKTRALTAEGRFSAWFLSLFPVFMIFMMSGLQPGYYEKASDYAYFPHAVVVTFFLLMLNVVAMRMITKLEV